MCLNIIDMRSATRSARRALVDVLALFLGFGLAAGVATNGGECCNAPAAHLEAGQ
ncbi:hypothetical protein [Archangium sp. Cb G35]|uniref:hypothetical protein n=1 Tax=Archangium sp. Cb G35 TaxID=1920190 RepID=UPI000AF07ACF|nr:hypothetical protein [Archangium sp. Cb G35]